VAHSFHKPPRVSLMAVAFAIGGVVLYRAAMG
jgi:hypothetical protein